MSLAQYCLLVQNIGDFSTYSLLVLITTVQPHLKKNQEPSFASTHILRKVKDA